jgi:RNA polymerase sigma factor (sigma-70 family)
MNDEQLAQRAAAGDQRAFEAIFRRYHQDLYRFCMTTVGNPHDAQDALQNTMVKALRSLPGEEREVRLKPWLYRIARNESVEILRRRRDNAELEPEQAASIPEIAETTALRERLRRLLVDLEELPERQRSTLTMRELAGLDFGEIGEALGTSAAVARQTLYEARLSLRQMEAGREMDCDSVMRALSDADGRVTRRRDIRAHLRGCAECRAFRDAMAERRGDLAAIAPLPLAIAGALLQGLLEGQAGALGAGAGAASAAGAGAASAGGVGAGGAGSVAGTIGAGAGKAVATSAIVKSVATVAVVATVGAGAADRSGVIDLPLTRGSGKEKGVGDPAAPPAAGERAGPKTNATPASAGGKSAQDGREPAGAQSKAKSPANAEHAAKAVGRGPAQAGKPVHPVRAKPMGGRRHGNSSHGKSQAARRGPPENLPPASGHGQQNAATRKPPQANRSPGRGGESSDKTAAPKSPKSEGAIAPPPAPPPAPVAPSSPGKSGSAPKGTEAPAEAVTP